MLTDVRMYVQKMLSLLMKIRKRSLIRKIVLNAEDVHQSVHTVRSQTEKDLVKEPVRSMLYIWVRTNALKLTIINVFPAAHVFISAHSERLLTSPLYLTLLI